MPSLPPAPGKEDIVSNIFRHDDYEVTQAPGGFRVTEMRTQNVFFVRLEIRFGKSAAGPCSCGSAAAEVPVFECRHQRAVFALLRQRYLSNLARSGLFRHPERLSLKFERDQEAGRRGREGFRLEDGILS